MNILFIMHPSWTNTRTLLFNDVTLWDKRTWFLKRAWNFHNISLSCLHSYFDTRRDNSSKIIANFIAIIIIFVKDTKCPIDSTSNDFIDDHKTSHNICYSLDVDIENYGGSFVFEYLYIYIYRLTFNTHLSWRMNRWTISIFKFQMKALPKLNYTFL